MCESGVSGFHTRIYGIISAPSPIKEQFPDGAFVFSVFFVKKIYINENMYGILR